MSPAPLDHTEAKKRFYGKDFPIWTGGFWGLAADVPVPATAPAPIPPGQNIVLQTTGQNMLALSDVPASPSGGGVNAERQSTNPA